jgi:hypothetical protein
LPATGTASCGMRTLPIPNTQFLLCLKVYIDKTGKSASQTHQLLWQIISPFSATPEEVSPGTVGSMASTGIPPRLGGWLQHKEEEVLSQQQDMRQDQLQLPQSDGSCAAGGTCCPTKGGSKLMCGWVTSCTD